MRLMIWFHRVPARSDLMKVWELRGGPLFERLRMDGCILPKIPLKVFHAGEGVPIFSGERAMPGDIIFADLSLLVENEELADEAFSIGCPVIVDLHFPFDRVNDIQAVSEILAGSPKDSLVNLQAQNLWADPERRRRALYILRTADAVTLGPVGYAVGIKGTRLPDLKTKADIAVFYRQFARLVITLQPGGRIKKLWRRMICRLPIWLYSQDVADRTELSTDV